MAIIKCPECGRQISDKAPTCPNCGVRIAGNIVKCPECGEVYFADQQMCPICHHPNPLASGSATVKREAVQPTATPTTETTTKQPSTANNDGQNDENTPAPKRGRGVLLISFIFAVAVAAVCYYFYHEAKTTKEQEAYEAAMRSNDPLVLQTYLDANADAPEAHIDSVQARLQLIRQVDADWNNAVVSGSKSALEDYLANHPDSPHKMEAMMRIDSIDWSEATNLNTLEAIQSYVDKHPSGKYLDEANDMLKTLKAKTVQPEEKAGAMGALRTFFQSVNARDAGSLSNSVEPLLSNFLGKTDATQEDVISFMNKIYKEDVSSMVWQLGSDQKVDKREVGDEVYEYTIQCSATQVVITTEGRTTNHYRVKATVSPDKRISALTLVKILQ